eukprot:m.10925 g.10925  ORF g.10925 m.10925 type:complete len:936 (+) comp4350_c0_seq2:148-2955(+)
MAIIAIAVLFGAVVVANPQQGNINKGKKIAILTGTYQQEIVITAIQATLDTSSVHLITPQQLTDTSIVNTSSFDALLVVNSSAIPACGLPSVVNFARNGGALILLGGKLPLMNLTKALLPIQLISPYEPYQMKAVSSFNRTDDWAQFTQQEMATINLTAPVSGLSAMGWPRFAQDGSSQFVPLLEGLDKFSRSRGWLLSCVTNTGGVYNNSVWIFSGVTETAFYTSPSFLKELKLAIALLIGNAQTNASMLASNFWNSRIARQNEMVENLQDKAWIRSKPAYPNQGVIRVSSDKKHLVVVNSNKTSRYFVLGGDYYRGPYSNSISPDAIEIDLNNAVLAGFNTLRLYGFSQDQQINETIVNTFKKYYNLYGIRILFTLQCYKDTNMYSKESVINVTMREVQQFANADWILGYDLCNEPDDNYLFPGFYKINDTTTLKEMYPETAGWGNYTKWQCGGWSSTLSECRNLSGPVLQQQDLPPADAIAFKATSEMFGDWLSWRKQAIRATGDNHLITVGHNSLHTLLPSNADYLDYVAHHAYPTRSADNLCSDASLDNISAISDVLQKLDNIWKGENATRPITLGEFGTTTTIGLDQYFVTPVQIPTDTSQSKCTNESIQQTQQATTNSCSLPVYCIDGVVSSIDWYQTHNGGNCDKIWQNAIADNAGNESIHKRCPNWAGVGMDAWVNSVYRPCWESILEEGHKDNVTVCIPTQPPPCVAMSLSQMSAYDLATWLVSLARGFDGALRWAMAETPYVLSVFNDAWQGDNQRDASAHAMYAAGGRFGLYWFDGAVGKPKPLAWATYFLRQYLSAVEYSENIYNFTWFNDNRSFAGYLFQGDDIVVVSASQYNSDMIMYNTPSDVVIATVMVAFPKSLNNSVKIMSTVDVNVTISMAKLSKNFASSLRNIAGKHGGVNSMNSNRITLNLLEGEIVTVLSLK